VKLARTGFGDNSWLTLVRASKREYRNDNKEVYFLMKIDQLDVTCFIISLFTAQNVSNVSTDIFRSLRLIADLFHLLYCSGSMCVGVTVWFGWGGVVSLCRLKQCFSLHKYKNTNTTQGYQYNT
jgi:hypothetical protein